MIDTKQLVEQLKMPKQNTAAGIIYSPRLPLELDPEFFDELESETLLGFEYESHGAPTSWFSTLELLQFEDNSVAIVYVHEELPIQLFARIEPASNRELWRSFIVDLFHDNGDSYGVEILTLLPTRTENHRPELITRQVLYDAYRQFMVWAEQNKPLPWADLQDTLAWSERGSEIVLADKLDLESTFDRKRHKETIESLLSQEEKQDLLERYFQRCYTEF